MLKSEEKRPMIFSSGNLDWFFFFFKSKAINAFGKKIQTIRKRIHLN